MRFSFSCQMFDVMKITPQNIKATINDLYTTVSSTHQQITQALQCTSTHIGIHTPVNTPGFFTPYKENMDFKEACLATIGIPIMYLLCSLYLLLISLILIYLTVLYCFKPNKASIQAHNLIIGSILSLTVGLILLMGSVINLIKESVALATRGLTTAVLSVITNNKFVDPVFNKENNLRNDMK